MKIIVLIFSFQLNTYAGVCFSSPVDLIWQPIKYALTNDSFKIKGDIEIIDTASQEDLISGGTESYSLIQVSDERGKTKKNYLLESRSLGCGGVSSIITPESNVLYKGYLSDEEYSSSNEYVMDFLKENQDKEVILMFRGRAWFFEGIKIATSRISRQIQSLFKRFK